MDRCVKGIAPRRQAWRTGRTEPFGPARQARGASAVDCRAGSAIASSRCCAIGRGSERRPSWIGRKRCRGLRVRAVQPREPFASAGVQRSGSGCAACVLTGGATSSNRPRLRSTGANRWLRRPRRSAVRHREPWRPSSALTSHRGRLRCLVQSKLSFCLCSRSAASARRSSSAPSPPRRRPCASRSRPSPSRSASSSTRSTQFSSSAPDAGSCRPKHVARSPTTPPAACAPSKTQPAATGGGTARRTCRRGHGATDRNRRPRHLRRPFGLAHRRGRDRLPAPPPRRLGATRRLQLVRHGRPRPQR